MEYFDILDEQGNQTGESKPRTEVHRDGDWHRTAHIWIANRDNNLLMQKRAANKDSHPNQWDISSAGHISAGDDSVTAAVREVQEELGIKAVAEDFKYLFTLTSQSVTNGGTFVNNEFQDVYLLRLDDLDIDKLSLQAEEIAAVRWVALDELAEVVKNQSEEFVGHWEEYSRVIELLKK